MNKDKPKLSLQQLTTEVSKYRKYLWVFVLVFFIVVYSYVILSIQSFKNEQPSQSQISSNLKTTSVPVINQNVVNQLESMKNNSVSVTALFNQSRQNPFQ